METMIETSSYQLIEYEPPRIDHNPAAVYLAGLSPNGRRTMLQSLNQAALILSNGREDALTLDWAKVRFQHTAAVRAQLIGHYKPATINKILCAIRGTLKAAWRLGLISAEDYQKARDVQSVIGHTVPAGRELQTGEILGLMQACERDPSAAGTRDAAIIGILYSAGLRREELVNLNLNSLDTETGKLLVFGKRSKERTVYLVNGALAALMDWLMIRGDQPGPLFLPVNKGGAVDPRRLTPQAVYNMLRKRAGQAGVKGFSPHDLRRTFVSDLLDAGADIATVAKMAGHSSVTTTARYDRRPEESKRKAACLLHLPYKQK